VSRFILPNFRPDSCGLLIRQSNRLRMRVHSKPGDNRRHGDQSRFFCIGPLIISWSYFSRILLESMRHVILDTAGSGDRRTDNQSGHRVRRSRGDFVRLGRRSCRSRTAVSKTHGRGRTSKHGHLARGDGAVDGCKGVSEFRSKSNQTGERGRADSAALTKEIQTKGRGTGQVGGEAGLTGQLALCTMCT